MANIVIEKNDTQGEDLYDKNKNKLEDEFKKVTRDIPKDDLYDKYGKKLGKGYRKLESDILTRRSI